MRPVTRALSTTIAAVIGTALAVAGCTGDEQPGPTGASSSDGSSAGNASATSPGQAPWASPAWEQVSNFPYAEIPAKVSLYPLQRVAGHLLLTVDVTPQGAPGQDMNATALFCDGTACGSMEDVSLIDPVSRVRYGPLLTPSGKPDQPYAGTPFASLDKRSRKVAGQTYRYGAFFPDPGPSVSALSADLLRAGIALDVPIVDGGEPAPDLIDTVDAVQSRPSVGPSGRSPAPGSVTTLRVPQPTADAVVEKHDLIAPIAGGKVNDSGAGKRGLVTLNADVLFAFDSAALTPAATALIAQAAQILASKADPARPVQITGYTDAKGSPPYNLTLSAKRAASVAAALAEQPAAQPFTRSTAGQGEKDPVAPNTTADGADDPAGRALNRRVEIAYTPKAAPAPTPSAANPTPSGTAGTTTGQGPTVTFGPAGVKSNGVPAKQMTATVHPITRHGTLTLIRLDLVAAEETILIDAFSSRDKADRDVGRFTIVDPATKTTYLPAYDADDPDRILGSYALRFDAGVPYRYFVYTAGIPQTLTSPTVQLGQLGSAPVTVQP
jgi:OOP family OmpA-OmpF porin